MTFLPPAVPAIDSRSVDALRGDLAPGDARRGSSPAIRATRAVAAAPALPAGPCCR